MQTNLQTWMDQYAARFTNPQAMSAPPPQNLVAQNTPMPGAQSPVAVPGAPPAGAPPPGAMGAQPPAPAPAGPPAKPGAPIGDADADQSFEGMFKQMPEYEQESAVDRLEKQVGSINKAYDQMQEQLGQRPDTKLSRREKGMLVMEFGLQLMSQSGAEAHGGDVGGAIGDAGLATMKSYRGQAADKKADAEKWDTNQRNLTSGRLKDLSGANKDFHTEQRQEMQDQNLQARADETARHNQEMESQGNARLSNLEDWRNTQVEKGIGAGRRGGAGGAGGAGGRPTANVQNIDDLVKRGIPEDLAVRLVYRQIKDPLKAWKELYDARRKTFSTEADAKMEADEIIGFLYGKDAVKGATAQIVPAAKPTAEVVPITGDADFEKLPSGQRFKGPDGKTRRKP